MPGIGGVDAIRRIVANDARSRILILKGFGSDDHVLAAIKSGAFGYLLKDSEPRELIRAIRQVHKGEPWLDPVIARKVFDYFLLGEGGPEAAPVVQERAGDDESD